MFLRLLGSCGHGFPFSPAAPSCPFIQLPPGKVQAGPGSAPSLSLPRTPPASSLLTASSWAPAAPNPWPSPACALEGGTEPPHASGQTEDQASEQPRRPLRHRGRQVLSHVQGGCDVSPREAQPRAQGPGLGRTTLACPPTSKRLSERSTVSLSRPVPQHRAPPVPLRVEWMSPCHCEHQAWGTRCPRTGRGACGAAGPRPCNSSRPPRPPWSSLHSSRGPC